MRRRSFALVGLLVVLFASYYLGTVLHGQAPPAVNVVPERTSYRDVVKKVMPAVVSLEAKAATRTKAKQPLGKSQLDPRVPEEVRRFFEEFGRSPFDDLPEVPRLGFGSGFIIDPKGVIVTNYHVVDGAEQVTVTLADGRKFVSKDVRGDRRTDLAIVRIDVRDGKPLPALEFADSEAMEIGDRVLAFGAPFGLTGSVTSGIISAKGRSGLSVNMYEDFLQTDAAINPGNSGGPLVNLDGKVVGINSAIKSRNGGFQGVGLAIASNLAKNIMKALQTDGVVRRGYLGIQIRELAPDVADRLGLKDGHGVLVGEVYANTPAAKADLQPGDVITAIGNTPIKNGRALQTLVAGLPLKKPVAVTVIRDGKPHTISVTIEEQPEDFGVRAAAPPPATRSPEGVGIDKLGIEIADLTEQLAEELGYKRTTKGVVITRVESNSLSAEAGLRRGMLITKIDRQPVTSAAATRELLSKASLEKGILLQVHSSTGGTNFVLLQATGTP